jgi:hypothetical protein
MLIVLPCAVSLAATHLCLVRPMKHYFRPRIQCEGAQIVAVWGMWKRAQLLNLVKKSSTGAGEFDLLNPSLTNCPQICTIQELTPVFSPTRGDPRFEALAEKIVPAREFRASPK